MGIEIITTKIIEEARAEGKEIIEKAEQDVARILADAEKKVAEIKVNSYEGSTNEKNKAIHQKKAVADIDERKLLLQKKQDMIDACFEKAADVIASMGEDDTVNFLSNLVIQTGLKDGTIILNAKDKKITEKLLKTLADKIAESNFVVSDEDGDFKGGLKLLHGKRQLNATIESLIEEERNRSAQLVAEMLFE